MVLNSNNQLDYITDEDTVSIYNNNALVNTYNIKVNIPISNITINSTERNVLVNTQLQLSEIITPENTTDSKEVTWISSDENIATVDENGLVRFISRGNVTITVTSSNNISASVTFRVMDPKVLDINVNNSEYICLVNDDDFNINYSIITQDNPSYNVEFTSSNNMVVSVNNDGKVNINGPGTANIMITAGNVHKIVTINVFSPINSLDIGNDFEIEYSKTKKLNLDVNPSNTTDEKVFFWASSNNNIVTVDSTGTIKAVGLGSTEITVCTKKGICDSVVITVTKVNANSLSYSGIGNRVYTGKQIKPGVTIKYNGMTLKNGTDYTLSYGANKNTGKGSVKITLKGNYTGSKTLYFNIIPKKVAISSVKSNSKKTATVKYKKTTGASGYQIAYRLKGSKTWKYTTSTKLSKKITKLKRYKKYNFKVRAYKTIDGKKYYGAYSSTKTIKIK